MKKILVLLTLLGVVQYASSNAQTRCRDLGIEPGVMNTGNLNSISDVVGVSVGHSSIAIPGKVCTGVTAILPHQGNVFQSKVPAAVYVGNGFGKLVGTTQINELGYLETPILLTNTLSVPEAAKALIKYTLDQEGNEDVRSVNPLVGETNDGYLNDIRGQHVQNQHIVEAIAKAQTEVVEEGCIGAGTGTVCFGYKGGIGTSSRQLSGRMSEFTVGVLVQTNFGGDLKVDGYPFAKKMKHPTQMEPSPDGSCMIIVATNAPLSAQQLKRLAKRALLGLGRTGGTASNGSGDYVIAFSTAVELREDFQSRSVLTGGKTLRNDKLSGLFQACIEATEEAILNSLFAATKITGYKGRTVPLFPVDELEK